MNTVAQFDDIKHGFYINLARRTDRNAHAIEEFKRIKFTPERFNAIETVNGAIGCTSSHLKCLMHAKENNWDHVFICEDDIHFPHPEEFRHQLDAFLKKHKGGWDVVLLGGNNFRPYTTIDRTCIKVQKCQTTTGYIVAGHYIQTLLDNVHSGLDKLIRNPTCHHLYAIDQYWFQLQKKDRWFLITPYNAIQRPGYSDIEHRTTNYKQVLSNVDKEVVYINGKRVIRINPSNI